MLQTQRLTLEDFSGGITDNFIDSASNKYQEAKNFLITENRKLEVIPGSDFYDETKAQIPLGNSRVGAIIDFNDELLLHASTKLFYEGLLTWTELQGPDSNDAFNAGDANSVISYNEWNDHLLITNDEYSPTIKVYKDNADSWQLRSAGLPELATSPIVTGNSGGGNDYIYAFHYFYEYQVGTVTYRDFGPTVEVQETDIDTPDISTVAITGIPVLTNSGGKHWDLANVKVRIYRTIAGGETLYFIGEINNGTTIYNDTAADNTINTNATIYTTGGVLDNGEPPLAKALHVNNGVAWYGNIKSGTEIIQNRVYQSVLSDPDSVPVTNFIDLEDEIIAISSYLDRTIVLCSRSVYRLDGVFDSTGGGGVTYQKISDTIGCVSLGSVTQVQNGVVFASEEGFAYTDGFDTYKISDGFNKRYRNLVKTDLQKKRMRGAYDRIDGRVWFSVQSSDGINDDIDTSYILDTRYRITEDSTFTTAGNQEEWAPTALVFKDGDLIRGDKRGYIFKHDDELFSHRKVDLLKVPADWFKTAIRYDFITHATSFGDFKFRKFVPRMILNCENISNLSTQIRSITDIGSRERDLPLIRWRGNFIWGDPLFEWYNDEFVWGTPGFIQEMRRFAGDDLRCTYKQLQVTNGFVVITESEGFDTCTVDSTADTVTLTDTANNDWPEEMGGYFIYFDDDNYTQGYEILSRTADTLTVDDPSSKLQDGSNKNWEIRGYPQEEVIKILSIVMLFALQGQTQHDFAPSSLGGNT